MNDTSLHIPIDQLHPFPGNPFHVKDDDSLLALIQSIRGFDLIIPILARPREIGGFEIISGHRRKVACEKAEIGEVPAFVREMNRDTAIIALVDSKLHRENLLPSEKAFAYKMKMEAIKRQGQRSDLTSRPVVEKLSADIVGQEMNKSQSEGTDQIAQGQHRGLFPAGVFHGKNGDGDSQVTF
ncbi:MAG: ParB/RepB/Spo0J family partition protein [Clostridia bacterium]